MSYLDFGILLWIAGAEFVVFQVSRQFGDSADQNSIVKVNVFEAVRMCSDTRHEAFQIGTLQSASDPRKLKEDVLEGCLFRKTCNSKRRKS